VEPTSGRIFIGTSLACSRAAFDQAQVWPQAWQPPVHAGSGFGLSSLLQQSFAFGAPHKFIRHGRPDGIFISEFEQGEIGPDLFRKACEFGLEGLVSKHRDRPYRGGRQKFSIKCKNRQHPAFNRVMDAMGL
jgi:bifunctional non-homologous end joining protein LigD